MLFDCSCLPEKAESADHCPSTTGKLRSGNKKRSRDDDDEERARERAQKLVRDPSPYSVAWVLVAV